MLYAILSDVHANPSALEKALADARGHGAEKIVCLGDVVGYGPDPTEAVALCRSACDVTLMGNHDAAVAGLLRTDNFIAFAQDGVRRHAGALAAADIAWLRALPYQHCGKSFICVHGTLLHPERFSYMYDADQICHAFGQMAQRRRRLLFVGHTHQAGAFVCTAENRVRMMASGASLTMEPKEKYIVNVGSVGYPRADHDITYVLYDTRARTVVYRHLPFDFDGYLARLEAKGVIPPRWLLDYMGRAS